MKFSSGRQSPARKENTYAATKASVTAGRLMMATKRGKSKEPVLLRHPPQKLPGTLASPYPPLKVAVPHGTTSRTQAKKPGKKKSLLY